MSGMIRRFTAAGAAALLAVALVAAPASAAPDPKARYGDTMVIGITGDPGTLNGTTSSNFVEKIIASNVFSMLIRLDRNFKPVPDLAKSWTISDDGLTYTFKLNEGVKWHDGQPFSSADVKYTIDEVILPLHTRAGTYKSVIDKVDAPDANTVIIRLKQPFGPLMNALGYDFLILPKHLYEGTDIKTNPYNAKPVGTGPFKFAEWKKGSYVILDKNKDYFVKGIPYLDRLVFQEIPDAAARVLALESGDIDYLAYQALPSSSVPRLKTNPKLVTSLDGFEALASIEILAFNMDNPQLKDVRVRQAIAYAINKQEIVDKADYGIGKAATGPISSLTTWAYEPNVNKYPYDPKRAAKLLDDAGFPMKPDGARMTLRLIADGGVELNRKASEILKEQLAQVGHQGRPAAGRAQRDARSRLRQARFRHACARLLDRRGPRDRRVAPLRLDEHPSRELHQRRGLSQSQGRRALHAGPEGVQARRPREGLSRGAEGADRRSSRDLARRVRDRRRVEQEAPRPAHVERVLVLPVLGHVVR